VKVTDCIQLAKDRDQWQTHVNTLINLHITHGWEMVVQLSDWEMLDQLSDWEMPDQLSDW
jgi:hypothetical protein